MMKKALVSDVKSRSNKKLSFMDWIEKYYRLPKSDNAPEGKLVFDDRPYLLDIYKCENPRMVIKKASRVGASEYVIAKSFYYTSMGIGDVMYTMPTADLLGKFVSSRPNLVIENSPYISSKMKSGTHAKDDVGVKRIGDNYIFFCGSNSRSQIISLSAKIVILDELSEMVMKHVDLVEKRVGAEKDPIVIKLSIPKYEDYGIDVPYKESDQREWFVKCPICNKEQTIRFPQNLRIDPPQNDYWCDKHSCDGRLDPLKGQWIATNPKSDIAGFHITGMMNPRKTALQIIRLYKNPLTNIEEFWWQDIGYEYSPEGSKMTRSIIDACKITNGEPVFKDTGSHCRMGVDVGKVFHVQITENSGDKKITRFIGTVKNPEDLDKLMNRYDVDVCVIDALPETRIAKAFASRFRGRVWLAYYNLKGSELCKYDNKTDKVTGEITPEVRINRTLAIDSMYSEIESRSIVLPPNLDDIDGFYDQMCALTKVPKLNPNTGNIEYSYVGGTVDEYGKPTTSGKPDHYTHVSVYNLIAWQAQVYRRFRKLKAAVL